MIKAHQIKLQPTKAQKIFFIKSCGVARFAYNWGLDKWQQDYKNGLKQSANDLIKHLNSIKKKEFAWMQETGKTCSQYGIRHLESAFKKMWKEKSGYPQFKKKGVKDSFVAVENILSFKQKNNKIWIPRLGWVKCCENLRFEGKVNNVTVKRISDMWFAVVNINVENKPIEVPTANENQVTVGIDMGINTMLVLSDGSMFKSPRALRNNLKQLKRLQRGLTRKNKGSNNRKKQQIKLGRKHYRIASIRKNSIHQATSAIIKKYDKIVIETLKPMNMGKNHKLSQAIMDISFGEISRQLAYKAKWQQKELVKANQWFASSKVCSNCGHKKTILRLEERLFKCDNCGLVVDRDINAAKNLAKYNTPKCGEIKACGERIAAKQSASMKQEIS